MSSANNSTSFWGVGDAATYVSGPPHLRGRKGQTVTVKRIGKSIDGTPCATIRFADGYQTAVRACAKNTNIRPIEAEAAEEAAA